MSVLTLIMVLGGGTIAVSLFGLAVYKIYWWGYDAGSVTTAYERARRNEATAKTVVAMDKARAEIHDAGDDLNSGTF